MDFNYRVCVPAPENIILLQTNFNNYLIHLINDPL